MILPSKVTSFKESVLSDAMAIGHILKQKQSCGVSELLSESNHRLGFGVEVVMDALDLLYALHKIDFHQERLCYVD